MTRNSEPEMLVAVPQSELNRRYASGLVAGAVIGAAAVSTLLAWKLTRGFWLKNDSDKNNQNP